LAASTCARAALTSLTGKNSSGSQRRHAALSSQSVGRPPAGAVGAVDDFSSLTAGHEEMDTRAPFLESSYLRTAAVPATPRFRYAAASGAGWALRLEAGRASSLGWRAAELTCRTARMLPSGPARVGGR